MVAGVGVAGVGVTVGLGVCSVIGVGVISGVEVSDGVIDGAGGSILLLSGVGVTLTAGVIDGVLSIHGAGGIPSDTDANLHLMSLTCSSDSYVTMHNPVSFFISSSVILSLSISTTLLYSATYV